MDPLPAGARSAAPRPATPGPAGGDPPPAVGIIGTAGHVDHGKTALVRALTGADTDRLPEEKRRGISIDIGFADLPLPSGRRAGLVDVPGHERFIRNMVAGASGVDLGLLVVAADEGAMPQTREHLDILLLLGVRRAVLALTKSDLVDAEWLDLAREDARALVAPTPLRDAPLVAVSSVTGEGLEALRGALDAGLQGAEASRDRGFARMPVDRVFSVPGFGTVATGTLTSGTIAALDHLELLPAGRAVRVRGLQVHGRAVPSARAGQRVACNLAGVERADVRRGDVLAAPGSLRAERLLAVRLEALSRLERPLRHGARLHLHLGTAEVLCRLTLLEGDELAPGASAFALLRLETAAAAGRGDRFIVRSYSPVTTVGGGTVVEVGRRFRRGSSPDREALRRAERGDPRDLLFAAVARGGPLPLAAAAAAAGLPVPEALAAAEELRRTGRLMILGDAAADGALVTPEGWTAVADAARSQLALHQGRYPLRPGMPREALRRAVLPGPEPRVAGLVWNRLAEDGVLRIDGDLVALPGHRPELPEDLAGVAGRLCGVLDAAGLQPPAVGEALRQAGFAGDDALRAEFLAHLASQQRVERVAPDLYFSPAAVAAAALRVREHLRAHGTMTVAELRDLLGVTRRHAVPIAEHLDAIRVTRREGDVRRLGG